MKRRRLDELLFEKGIAQNKAEAFTIVTEGRVSINGQKAVSPAQLVDPDAEIEVRSQALYVGRGAYKLEAALDAFKIDPSGKICADIGAATGGFTQVLLKNGARKVYAIDTARGKLALKLRQDPRVIVMEGTDVRDIASLPDRIELAVIDVSLIPLRDILTAVRRLLAPKGEVVALFKPQYETRDPRRLHHGVIRDPEERETLMQSFAEWAEANAWRIQGRIESPIRGSKGNVEYLFVLNPEVSMRSSKNSVS